MTYNNSIWQLDEDIARKGHVYFDVIECVIGIMGSVTNIMVLLAIYKERKLRTITNCFVGSLAASDVLVGLMVPPLVIMSNEGLKIQFQACVLSNSAVVLLTNISVLNLLSVALERFLAIRKPFMYRRWMTINRAKYLVAATWVVAVFIGLVPVMGWNNGDKGYSRCSFIRVISLEYLVYFIFFIFTLPPLTAMTLIYMYIFTVVRRTKRMTKKLMLSQGANRFKQTIKKNTRGDISILLVIVLFMLCWMPLHITNTVLLFSTTSRIPLELYLTCNTLSRFNSLINPFLFAFGYTRFKVVIKRILFGRCIQVLDEQDEQDLPELAMVNRRLSRLSVKVKGQSISLPSEDTGRSKFMNFMDEYEHLSSSPEGRYKSKRSETNLSMSRTDMWETMDSTNMLKQLEGSGNQPIFFTVVDMMSDEVIWEVSMASLNDLNIDDTLQSALDPVVTVSQSCCSGVGLTHNILHDIVPNTSRTEVNQNVNAPFYPCQKLRSALQTVAHSKKGKTEGVSVLSNASI